jgi:dihydroorotase
MIEVETLLSWEDPDEIRRLENLSTFCSTNGWEFYIACADEKTRELTSKKISNRNVRVKETWLTDSVPFAKHRPVATAV